MAKFKFMDKTELVSINREAIRSNRNRTLVTKKLEELGDDTLFPIGFSFPHNGAEMRCRVQLSDQGDQAWLDMPMNIYDRLREYELKEEE
jgi:hypothetical protein